MFSPFKNGSTKPRRVVSAWFLGRYYLDEMLLVEIKFGVLAFNTLPARRNKLQANPELAVGGGNDTEDLSFFRPEHLLFRRTDSTSTIHHRQSHQRGQYAKRHYFSHL
jgi:hypothetical protein